ncbi:MAG: fatty acid desaturase [Phycisphaerae bacterium]|nr:fatty acid desaturase [Phycisphaerae bacterium]
MPQPTVHAAAAQAMVPLVIDPPFPGPPRVPDAVSSSSAPDGLSIPGAPAAHAADHRSSPAERRVLLLNLGAVVIPTLALGLAMYLAWGRAFNWTQAIIFIVMTESTALGVTVGFHRLFTHRAFQTVAPIKYALGALGSMSVQGTVIEWAAAHRRHHQHSDERDDPHSPHVHAGGSWGEGFMAIVRGFLHAHFGWLFTGRNKGMGRYVKDLTADPVTAAVNRHFRYWVFAGLLAPALIGGLIEQSWWGAFLGFLWGGLVRVLFVHHVTWSVNSVCHLWGARPFRTGDHSRNNPVIGVLTLGEGWHNNHHAFPNSARHGLAWWQLDLSYLFIRALAAVGLAWSVRVPDPDRVAAKRNA